MAKDSSGYEFLCSDGRPSTISTTVTQALEVGASYRYRVKTRDLAGNSSDWEAGFHFAVDRQQETRQALTYTGGWRLQALRDASGGYVKHANSSEAEARFDFAGRSVAWVAPKGPNRGKAQVWVDGEKQKTVDLYSSSTRPRQMVFAKTWASSSDHTLRMRVLGTKDADSGGTRVDVDAFVALRKDLYLTPGRDSRVLASLAVAIHRSAWRERSANFACTEF